MVMCENSRLCVKIDWYLQLCPSRSNWDECIQLLPPDWCVYYINTQVWVFLSNLLTRLTHWSVLIQNNRSLQCSYWSGIKPVLSYCSGREVKWSGMGWSLSSFLFTPVHIAPLDLTEHRCLLFLIWFISPLAILSVPHFWWYHIDRIRGSLHF